MSWVAEAKATRMPKSAMGRTLSAGSLAAMPSRPAAIPAWARSIQLRRRPSQRCRPGSGRRSTTGAHTTLIEKVMPIHEKKPMALRLISSSRSQAERVAKISRNGRPAENPRNSIAITRGWR